MSESVNDLLGKLVEEDPKDVANILVDILKKRFPEGKHSYETANELIRFSGLETAKIVNTKPLELELKFDEDAPAGPDPERDRGQMAREFEQRYKWAMDDWREFIEAEVEKAAKKVVKTAQVMDVKTPYTDVVNVIINY